MAWFVTQILLGPVEVNLLTILIARHVVGVAIRKLWSKVIRSDRRPQGTAALHASKGQGGSCGGAIQEVVQMQPEVVIADHDMEEAVGACETEGSADMSEDSAEAGSDVVEAPGLESESDPEPGLCC